MQWLKEFRKRLNFNTQQMATKIGVSKSLYEKIEFNQRKPSRNFISKFKKAFPEVDINIFFEH